jgi:NADH-quinone oxidoreductase subunit D
VAYASAVEDLALLEIPIRAKYIRTILAEAERIFSHLIWFGALFEILGYETLKMWCWKYREPFFELFQDFFGSRYHYAMIKIGGVNRDIGEDQMKALHSALDSLLFKIDGLQNIFEEDINIIRRLKTAGKIRARDAIEYCLVGPSARSAGINIDVRKDTPYAAYNLIDWSVPLGTDGTPYDMAQVRFEEIRQSIFMIFQCIEKLNEAEGKININIEEVPEGEGFGRLEGPGGEMFHYMKSVGGNVPYRHKIRPAAYMNLPIIEKILCGKTIIEGQIVIAAVGPCFSCIER